MMVDSAVSLVINSSNDSDSVTSGQQAAPTSTNIYAGLDQADEDMSDDEEPATEPKPVSKSKSMLAS